MLSLGAYNRIAESGVADIGVDDSAIQVQIAGL
jgi:hypothetical protein